MSGVGVGWSGADQQGVPGVVLALEFSGVGYGVFPAVGEGDGDSWRGSRLVKPDGVVLGCVAAFAFVLNIWVD